MISAFQRIPMPHPEDMAAMALCLACELQGNFWLWRKSVRTLGDSPHKETTDIWARYGHPEDPNVVCGAPHYPFWNPVVTEVLPAILAITGELMTAVRGEVLGGVLLTRIEPHGIVDWHVDSGWHAENYSKYHVDIASTKRSTMEFGKSFGGFAGGCRGVVHEFRNDISHATLNPSETPRISLIVCIKKFPDSGSFFIPMGIEPVSPALLANKPDSMKLNRRVLVN